jgi:hypothetical protein
MIHTPFVLFFDCYILSSKREIKDVYDPPNNPQLKQTYINIRSTDSAYFHKSKLDVTKYTLLSYRALNFNEIIIRYECEDGEDSTEFNSFCQKYFRDAKIFNHRSATASQYLDHLSQLSHLNNPWVFFSPNNDHTLIGNPELVNSYLRLAEEVEFFYPSYVVSVFTSHFVEYVNWESPDQPRWGIGSKNKVIGETAIAKIVSRAEGFFSPSIKILRLSTITKIFSETNNVGRCIRMEDALDPPHEGPKLKELTIYPKIELCRHFDGYFFENLPTHPLFIPDGFYESDIKIRFGFKDYKRGHVNINPYENISYLGGVADLQCLISEIPHFWKNRISEIDINDRFQDEYASNEKALFRYGLERCPYENSFIDNYINSAWVFCNLNRHQFNRSICHAEILYLNTTNPFYYIGTDSKIDVFFILKGAAMFEGNMFQRHDVFAIQGPNNKVIHSLVQDTQIVKVSINVGGGSNKAVSLNFIWSGPNGNLFVNH